MKVIITNQIEELSEELSIIDYKTGMDWIVDLLGNAGIHKDAETDAVTMDREEFDWWVEYINGYVSTEREIAELAEQADVEVSDIRNEVFEYMGQQDMENERGRAIQKLAELKEEYGVA